MLSYYWAICKELCSIMRLDEHQEREFIECDHEERIAWLYAVSSYMPDASLGPFTKLIYKLECARRPFNFLFFPR